MVILAAITKRAQIPFSAWLPAAMAAPTPVSALVHSSTLVTAGVYLLIRFSYLLNLNNFMFFIGSFTMFISGLGANFEIDLKKIIALSTLSQLGVIIIILSLDMPELAFFHLLSHALFKSLLFLCAGVFIHSIGDIQDIRYLGGLEIGCPVRSLYFTACSLSLCGFPFMSGFYSKDLILECFFIMDGNVFIFIAIVLGTVFTATYSLRLAYYLFFKNLGTKNINNLEEHLNITVPIRVLFIIAVSAGSAIVTVYFPCYRIFIPLMFKIMILLLIFAFSFFVYEGILNFELKKILFVKKINYFLGGM